MNQIISYIKLKNKKIRMFFYIQLILSIIIVLFLFIYIIIKSEDDKTSLTENIKVNLKISNIYNNIQLDKYIGNLIIEKINLEYPIFKEYSEENLNISICKFSGNNLNENGNITILGHNYTNRFFCNLEKLEINDKIRIDSNRRKN